MKELSENSRGLGLLFRMEWSKAKGILNGIDTEVWDPKTDLHLAENLAEGDFKTYKNKNKRAICDRYGFDSDLPLFTFIGRFAHEKGADLLPVFIHDLLSNGVRANFFILGSGDLQIQQAVGDLQKRTDERFNCEFAYNEPLSHLLYAGSDFLLMPSRVEPCGLNQLYALRYGSIPIVHSVGGLRDTVKDIRDGEGMGLTLQTLELAEFTSAVRDAVDLYSDSSKYLDLVKSNYAIDHSWESAAHDYLELYNQLT
jgi:starch synthase